MCSSPQLAATLVYGVGGGRLALYFLRGEARESKTAILLAGWIPREKADSRIAIGPCRI